MNKLLDVLTRIAHNLHEAMSARARSPLSAFLAHEERGGPAPR